ncbi:hypothetical protein CPB84DRAFT_1777061 [Gymnopilus junonius]|uniref:Uncharacterized protein n=1 Tax=Gymnopilus junonius TaxID=109634 RepID=A0A9P5NRK3_GYMJU|nr:hypothetical protein CPB84DRAFT_1777061 [Gymnopilus junonius]
MIGTVRRTGHSSFYVEKGSQQSGMQGEFSRVKGGAFPIWLENAFCCPIAVAACYSGSSQEDHSLVSTTIRDYLAKLRRNSRTAPTLPEEPVPTPHRQESREWLPDPPASNEFEKRPESPFDRHEEH